MCQDVSSSRLKCLSKNRFYTIAIYTYVKGMILIIYCCSAGDFDVLELVESGLECSKDGEMASQDKYNSRQTIIEWYVFYSTVVNT